MNQNQEALSPDEQARALRVEAGYGSDALLTESLSPASRMRAEAVVDIILNEGPKEGHFLGAGVQLHYLFIGGYSDRTLYIEMLWHQKRPEPFTNRNKILAERFEILLGHSTKFLDQSPVEFLAAIDAAIEHVGYHVDFLKRFMDDVDKGMYLREGHFFEPIKFDMVIPVYLVLKDWGYSDKDLMGPYGFDFNASYSLLSRENAGSEE